MVIATVFALVFVYSTHPSLEAIGDVAPEEKVETYSKYKRKLKTEGNIGNNEEVRPGSDYTSHSVARNQVPGIHKLDFKFE